MDIKCDVSTAHDEAEEKGLTRAGFIRLSGLALLGFIAGCSARSGSGSESIHDLNSDIPKSTLRYGQDSSIDLSSNENPLGPAPAAIRAITEQLYRETTISGINRYPDFMSLNIRASAARLNRVSPLKIVPLCGITEGISVLCAAYLKNGGDIITTDPTWNLVEKKALSWGANVIKVPLDSEHKIDVDSIIDRITPDTKLVYLMNPHNPAGTVVEDDKLMKLIGRLAVINQFRKGYIITVIDEAYGEYAGKDAFPDAVKYCRLFPVVVLRTSSFAYGMAGLRCGYAIARRDIAAKMDGSLLYYLNSALNNDAIAEIIVGHKGWKHPEGNINRLAEAGFISSLDDGQEHIEFVRTWNRRSMDTLCRELDRTGMRYIPSQACFLMVDTGDIDGRTAAKRLSEKCIIVRDGNEFGARYANFIRVSMGSEEEMNVFVSALKDVLG